MSMTFKPITDKIQQEFPEFYTENEDLIKKMNDTPEWSIECKDHFREMMRFLEELEELHIARMSTFKRWKTRREKKKALLADRSFENRVDILWSVLKAFQIANDKSKKELEGRIQA